VGKQVVKNQGKGDERGENEFEDRETFGSSSKAGKYWCRFQLRIFICETGPRGVGSLQRSGNSVYSLSYSGPCWTKIKNYEGPDWTKIFGSEISLWFIFVLCVRYRVAFSFSRWASIPRTAYGIHSCWTGRTCQLAAHKLPKIIYLLIGVQNPNR
jgi:hypothetical protein